jgi:hypothetical protein
MLTHRVICGDGPDDAAVKTECEKVSKPNAVPAVFVALSRVTRAGVNLQGCTRPSLAIGNATLSIRRDMPPSAACLCLCIFNQST